MTDATSLPPPTPLPPPAYFGGLDLGQMADYSALAVVERAAHLEDGRLAYRYAVRHLHRWPLRTAYPDIADDVVRLYARRPLAGSTLLVDRTGVGAPVCDMILRAEPEAWVIPVTITGGAQAGWAGGCRTVPKRDLAGALQALLGQRRLDVSPSLPLAQVLAREMQTFTVKINIATGNESFEAWRDRDHDDLVLAVATACWYGERTIGWDDGAVIIDTPAPSGRDRLVPRPNSEAQRRLIPPGRRW